MATALLARAREIEELKYPSSDGNPVAETDTHAAEIVALFQLLDERYAERADVYVAMNNLVYYIQNNEETRIAPDVYIVFGVPKRERRVYLLWDEKQPPAVVFEVSSRGTKHDDRYEKKTVYEQLGVKEYFIYDPENDYLKPPLQGFRLSAGGHRRIAPEADGTLLSKELGLKFDINPFGRIRAFDARTGAEILRLPAAKRAAEEHARIEAEARAKADAHARQEAERRKQAEAEVARLRDEIARLKKQQAQP